MSIMNSTVALPNREHGTLQRTVLALCVAIIVGIGLPFAITNLATDENQKWLAFLAMVLGYVMASIVLQDGRKAFVILLPAYFSFWRVLFIVGIDEAQFIRNNFFGYRPYIYYCEPFLLIGLFLGLTKQSFGSSQRTLQWIIRSALPYLLFLFVAVLTVFTTGFDASYALFGVLGLAKYILWFFVFALILAQNLRLISYLVLGFACFVGIQMLWSAMQILDSGLVQLLSSNFIHARGFTRVSGTMTRAALESSLMLILPLLFAFVVHNWPPQGWMARVIAMALGGGALVLFVTLTRGPVVAFLVSLPFALGMDFFRREKFRQARRGLYLLLPVVLVLGSVLFVQATDINNTLYRSGSIDFRIRNIIVGWQMILDNPVFGVGINNFVIAGALEQLYGMLHQDILFGRPVHNQYVLIMAEMGIIGFSSFIYVMWRWFQETRNVIQRSQEAWVWYPRGVLAAFVAFSLSCLADAPMIKALPLFIVAILFAGVVALRLNTSLSKSEHVSSLRSRIPKGNGSLGADRINLRGTIW